MLAEYLCFKCSPVLKSWAKKQWKNIKEGKERKERMERKNEGRKDGMNKVF